jgi:hypothetical protein
MKRLLAFSTVIAVLALVAAAAPAQAQTTFKIPFKWESGGKKFPAGDFVVARSAGGQLTFKQVSTAKETAVPFTEALKPSPDAPVEPRLVFDEVGNFEPSYTEYFTVYVLAEVWLTPQDGCLVHTTKGAHKTKVVKAEEGR